MGEGGVPPGQGCDDQLQLVHLAFESMANIKEYRWGLRAEP